MPNKDELVLKFRTEKINIETFNIKVTSLLKKLWSFHYNHQTLFSSGYIQSHFKSKELDRFLNNLTPEIESINYHERLKDCLISRNTFKNVKKSIEKKSKSRRGPYGKAHDLLALYYGWLGAKGALNEVSIKKGFKISDQQEKERFKGIQINPENSVKEKTLETYYGNYIAYGFDELHTEKNPRFFISLFQIELTDCEEIKFTHTRNNDDHLFTPKKESFYSQRNKILSLYLHQKHEMLTNLLTQLCFSETPSNQLIIPYISNTDTEHSYHHFSGTAFLDKIPNETVISNSSKKKLIARNLSAEKFLAQRKHFPLFDFEKALECIYSMPVPILYCPKS